MSDQTPKLREIPPPSRMMGTGEWQMAGDEMLATALLRRAPIQAEEPSLAQRARARADAFIHHPITEVVVIVLIVLSVLSIVVEASLPDGSVGRTWVARGSSAVTWVFAVELSIRFWVAPKKRRYFLRYWPDLLALIELLRPLRFLRILRLLRMFRAGQLFSRRLSIFQGALAGTMQEVTMLGTVTMTLVVAAAFVLMIFEGEANNAALDTIGETLWHSVYSLVGSEPLYGEPQTPVGRLATLALMFGGLTTFGMFVGTVSASMVSRFAGEMESKRMDLDELSGHTLVCGWNRAAPGVLQELFVGAPHPVVLVTDTEAMPVLPKEGLRRDMLYHLSGDYTKVEVLEQAGIRAAAAAIILSDSSTPRSDQDRDARTVLAALTVERLAPGIFTVAELTNRENAGLLKMAGVEEIVVADEYAATILGSASRNRGMVTVLDEILSARSGNSMIKCEVPRRLAGATVGKLHRLLKEKHDAVLVAVERPAYEDVPAVVEVNPPLEKKVRGGDLVLVISPKPPNW